VTASVELSVPAVVENETCVALKAFPFTSYTCALTVEEPPFDGTIEGLAFMTTLPTAAVPTRILSVPVAGTLLPPDSALIVAVPDAEPALNNATAWPLESVSASAGRMVPSVVVKVTWVPLCGGVPDGSIT
jgi:hypothetical protein